MKVKYVKKTDFPALTENKVYEVISIENGWYRIETDLIGDYLYPPELFEIVENLKEENIK
jgi:hypothetical protein